MAPSFSLNVVSWNFPFSSVMPWAGWPTLPSGMNKTVASATGSLSNNTTPFTSTGLLLELQPGWTRVTKKTAVAHRAVGNVMAGILGEVDFREQLRGLGAFGRLWRVFIPREGSIVRRFYTLVAGMFYSRWLE